MAGNEECHKQSERLDAGLLSRLRPWLDREERLTQQQMHWTASWRRERTTDTTMDVDMRWNREAGVGKGKAQRESLSALSYGVSIAV
jgi:hypothetical protein